MRKFIIAGAIAGTLAAGVGIGTGAHATTHPLLSTSTRTEVLISAKCYREYEKTVTYFHYSTKAGGYVAYVAPKTTITTSTHCHS
jgi:hypothetical protein